MEYLVISMARLSQWIRAENLFARDGAVVGVLLSGDRTYCCDEAVAGIVDEKIVGVATIAPEGEEHSGQPTIVAIYVHPDHRRKGYGKKIMEAVVRRCLERGFQNIRMESLSSYALRIISSLPEDLGKALDVHDCGSFMDLLI